MKLALQQNYAISVKEGSALFSLVDPELILFTCTCTVICKILATSFIIHDDVLLHHKHICPIVYLNIMVTIEIPVCCFPFECQESCKPLYIRLIIEFMG